MQILREIDFLKKSGISETLNWSNALITLHRTYLDEDVVRETLGCILKYSEDIKRFNKDSHLNDAILSEFKTFDYLLNARTSMTQV